jgi:6-phosphogluconolactonase
MNNPTERFFDCQQALNSSLFRNTEYQLQKSVEQNGVASLLVSGGSSPLQLYRQLSNSQLPWHAIQVGMVDERWVDPKHSKSNQRFIENTLIQDKAKNVRFVSMKTNNETAIESVTELHRQYEQLVNSGVTILGMGTDGHTASLFPKAKGLKNALETDTFYCGAISANQSEITGEQTERMTLTLKALMSSEIIYLIISGQEKLKTYRQALEGTDVQEMPVRSILLQQEVPVVVYWAP